MKKTQRFIINTLILTASTLSLQFIAVMFNSYLSRKIGSSGIGLYELILSVYAFGVTLATSGIRLATTRLIVSADTNTALSPKKVMLHCLSYSVIFGLAAGILLFCFSTKLSTYCFNDLRPILSLKILAISLPLLAMSSSLCGYFTAKRKISRFAFTQIGGQILRIIAATALLSTMLPQGMEFACAAIAIGAVVAEFMSFISLFILYLFERRKLNVCENCNTKNNVSITKKLLGVAIPDAISSYARSALVTIEHLLIPGGLKKNGATTDVALASYGALQGMALPVILFPAAIMNAMSNLLIPEIAEYCECRNSHKIDMVVSRVLEIAFIFSIGVTGILFTFSNELGMLIYNNSTASYFIKVLAPVIPIMYVDTAVDGVLKGMGQQVASMRYNIIDAFCSACLVYILLPHLGIEGYLITIIATEILNFVLSISKLVSITSFHINPIKAIVKPLLCIAMALVLSKLILVIFFAYSAMAVTCVVGIMVSGLTYYGFLRILHSLPNFKM